MSKKGDNNSKAWQEGRREYKLQWKQLLVLSPLVLPLLYAQRRWLIVRSNNRVMVILL